MGKWKTVVDFGEDGADIDDVIKALDQPAQPNTELREAIERLLLKNKPVQYVNTADLTQTIDGLTALFQAREQQAEVNLRKDNAFIKALKRDVQQKLITELLGELPEKELPEIKRGALIIEHEGKLVKTEHLAKMRNTGFNQAIDQVVSILKEKLNA